MKRHKTPDGERRGDTDTGGGYRCKQDRKKDSKWVVKTLKGLKQILILVVASEILGEVQHVV